MEEEKEAPIALGAHEKEQFHVEIMEALLSEPFFTRRMKMISKPDGFMLYGKLGPNFFSKSEWLLPNMKFRLQLIRARPGFSTISDNSNFCPGIVYCSLYTHRISLKHDCWKKRMDMLANTPVAFNYLETLAKTYINPDGQNQFNQGNLLNNAPARQTALVMNTHFAITGSYTGKPLWYQQFDLRQNRMLRGGQPITDFAAADISCLYVTTKKAMNFQDDTP